MNRSFFIIITTVLLFFSSCERKKYSYYFFPEEKLYLILEEGMKTRSLYLCNADTYSHYVNHRKGKDMRNYATRITIGKNSLYESRCYILPCEQKYTNIYYIEHTPDNYAVTTFRSFIIHDCKEDSLFNALVEKSIASFIIPVKPSETIQIQYSDSCKELGRIPVGSMKAMINRIIEREEESKTVFVNSSLPSVFVTEKNDSFFPEIKVVSDYSFIYNGDEIRSVLSYQSGASMVYYIYQQAPSYLFCDTSPTSGYNLKGNSVIPVETDVFIAAPGLHIVVNNEQGVIQKAFRDYY